MIEVVVADITTLAVDAIVNAANTQLRGGGGVDGAIHRAAGPELLAELMGYPGTATGTAVLTRGYRLRARYVIHAVGPVWDGGDRGEPEQLASAYEASFARAREAGDVRTIAFPAISTGVYGYPLREATRVATRVMRAHAHEYDRVIAAVLDPRTAAVYEAALAEGG